MTAPMPSPLFWLPAGLLALAGLALLAGRRWRRPLLGAVGALTYALATPAGAYAVIEPLQRAPAPTPAALRHAQAIVVLSAGRRDSSQEIAGGSTVDALGLERARYAAILARATGLPVLAAGGNGLGEALACSLRQDFGVSVTWVEPNSADTRGNAVGSARLLLPAIATILLVTHAWHMPRAVQTFQANGFTVIPAPTARRTFARFDAAQLVPNLRALVESALAVHEYLGIAWYRLAYGYPVTL